MVKTLAVTDKKWALSLPGFFMAFWSGAFLGCGLGLLKQDDSSKQALRQGVAWGLIFGGVYTAVPAGIRQMWYAAHYD